MGGGVRMNSPVWITEYTQIVKCELWVRQGMTWGVSWSGDEFACLLLAAWMIVCYEHRYPLLILFALHFLEHEVPFPVTG